MKNRSVGLVIAVISVILSMGIGVIIGVGVESSSNRDSGSKLASTSTPSSCLNALDEAEVLLSLAAQGFSYAADGLDASARLDVDAIELAASEMSTIRDEVRKIRPEWTSARDQCRDSFD